MSGMAGNKGAVAIRMDYANTQICFVTAHLAAGFANYEERNRDYRTINHGLRFQRNRSIDDHDTVIWLGDFNYRIGLSDERVRRLIQLGDLDSLYENDQVIGHNLRETILEADLHSSRKVQRLSSEELTLRREKARIPAWCDRILRKGGNLRQINYNTAPLRFSDHRPVYATFQCTVSVVDEPLRERLSRDIYERRRREVGGLITNIKINDTDDEDLIGYDSVAPGLPPASSDRQKWWLDNGLPAWSTIEAPGENFAPNPHRLSNPFVSTEQPDWVQLSKPPLSETSQAHGSAPLTAGLLRKPIDEALRKGPPFRRSGLDISPVTASNRSLTSQQLVRTSSPPKDFTTGGNASRGRAPPVPKKPVLLTSRGSQRLNLSGDNKDYSGLQHVDNSIAPPLSVHARPRPVPENPSSPPLPRRLTDGESQPQAKDRGPSTRLKAVSTIESGNLERTPPLPPRRQSTNEQEVLIDGDDEDMRNMTSWEPLHPR
ncbi:hypothetical protein GP486_002764 [Trichoglossum hirsutum]|uniref:Inositol polyphosphate-related phosphatase domain-containing protein n=1 Tax=Trichoglossum hirsutum TaxID=265104 RepID=A0A9P8RRT6_9PEZI|nr:hypothetical protein GP486_002764 [Trichoglossum hirsutum]